MLSRRSTGDQESTQRPDPSEVQNPPCKRPKLCHKLSCGSRSSDSRRRGHVGFRKKSLPLHGVLRCASERTTGREPRLRSWRFKSPGLRRLPSARASGEGGRLGGTPLSFRPCFAFSSPALRGVKPSCTRPHYHRRWHKAISTPACSGMILYFLK